MNPMVKRIVLTNRSFGKNLSSEKWRQTDYDGSYAANRVSTNQPFYIEKDKTYMFSTNTSANYQVSFAFCLTKGGAYSTTATWNTTTYTPTNNYWVYPVLKNTAATSFTPTDVLTSGFKFQAELGSVATDYEPYTGFPPSM